MVRSNGRSLLIIQVWATISPTPRGLFWWLWNSPHILPVSHSILFHSDISLLHISLSVTNFFGCLQLCSLLLSPFLKWPRHIKGTQRGEVGKVCVSIVWQFQQLCRICQVLMTILSLQNAFSYLLACLVIFGWKPDTLYRAVDTEVNETLCAGI